MVELTVKQQHLASRYAEELAEAYPDVLSTPALLGCLERACARLLQPLLQPGQMSVGVRVSLVHKAPTPLGATLRARAVFVRREKSQFVFEIQAEDAGGIVATGEHTRAIVPAAAVVQGAKERLQTNRPPQDPAHTGSPRS